VLLLLSAFVNERDEYAIGSWCPLWFCVKTAPHACLLASVIIQNYLRKSGYCNKVGSISLSFKYWNDFWHSEDHSNGTFFLRNLVMCRE